MTTLYGYITNTDDTPKYDDILSSKLLSKEQKAQAINDRAQDYNNAVDRQKYKDFGRIGLGELVAASSFHPILNIPYVGTGIGGALYDTGMGIMEGDSLPDIAKRAGRGFAIGETVGAVPYVGKWAGKTKAGQAVLNSAPVNAVGNVLNKAGEKFANSNLYDALMTDVKAFNPNKQTVYHGSPYDFNKFSNEAIGTGEGAQAHGLGHYAALDKDVAKRYKETLAEGSPLYEEYKSLTHHRDLLNQLNERIPLDDTLKNALKDTETKIYEIEKNNLPNEYLEKKGGQLYKLSVPKDDVMLREGATFAEQPKIVQNAIEKELKEQLGTFNYSGEQLESLRNLIMHQNPEELSKYGVKGISYNGGIDGEARVIFNPDDIDIVRKFYNQPNLFNKIMQKQNSGTLFDALINE